uniref:PcfJ domain-containing protein n=1 Tax=Thomasclavelia spiroformis TaxID=29348 RepID=UPI00359C1A52
MTKIVSNSEKLLDKLATLKLKQYNISKFKRWMISDGNPSWKRPKMDTQVNSFYAAVYEPWRNRIICRTFYVTQMWYNKQKETRIFEVKRQLAGCDKQLVRRLYSGMHGYKCWIYDENRYPWYYEDCDEWRKHSIKSYNLAVYNMSYYGYGAVEREDYHILNSEYEVFKMLRNSKHKYSGFEYNSFKLGELFEYLAMYEKHPAVEMISKLGLDYLLKTDLRKFRWSKKGIDIIGIEKKDILVLKKLHIPIDEFKTNKKYIYKFNILEREDYNQLLRLIEIAKNKYANINISKYSFDYFKKNAQIPLYTIKDYYKFCQKLALPMNHTNKYPDDIKKAHDDLMVKIETVKSKKQDEAILNRVNDGLNKLRFADDKYVITPANSSEDLIRESAKLNHCVKTYADKYAKGMTNIFLVRERENVNEPFYTLELIDNDIKQLRGNHNCKPTGEVVKFINKWANNFKFTGAYVTTLGEH